MVPHIRCLTKASYFSQGDFIQFMLSFNLKRSDVCSVVLFEEHMRCKSLFSLYSSVIFHCIISCFLPKNASTYRPGKLGIDPTNAITSLLSYSQTLAQCWS